MSKIAQPSIARRCHKFVTAACKVAKIPCRGDVISQGLFKKRGANPANARHIICHVQACFAWLDLAPNLRATPSVQKPSLLAFKPPSNVVLVLGNVLLNLHDFVLQPGQPLFSAVLPLLGKPWHAKPIES